MRVLSIMKQGADEEVLGRGERDLGMRKRGIVRDKRVECQCVASVAGSGSSWRCGVGDA